MAIVDPNSVTQLLQTLSQNKRKRPVGVQERFRNSPVSGGMPGGMGALGGGAFGGTPSLSRTLDKGAKAFEVFNNDEGKMAKAKALLKILAGGG